MGRTSADILRDQEKAIQAQRDREKLNTIRTRRDRQAAAPQN